MSIFHASVAGLGGCPYAKGATGNVATEDVLYMLHGMGIHTGVDLEQVVRAGDFISQSIGRANGSRVGRALLTKWGAAADAAPALRVRHCHSHPTDMNIRTHRQCRGHGSVAFESRAALSPACSPASATTSRWSCCPHTGRPRPRPRPSSAARWPRSPNPSSFAAWRTTRRCW
ncbi:hypothetical protein ACU4HD_23225 [Cupriavidus basilensis]